uniref:Uncharacterized protein n=1 Tax=Schistosoma curassoni TaxID=6186 RepID=A0A183JNQ3_9TREM
MALSIRTISKISSSSRLGSIGDEKIGPKPLLTSEVVLKKSFDF